MSDDEVSKDAVYRELYNEMRRIRDYEFTSSMWYTALLLAISGFILTVRFGHTLEDGKNLITASCTIRCIIVVAVAVVAGVSNYLVAYSASLYDALREWVDENLEPSWKKDCFPLLSRPHKPRFVYFATPWALVLFIVMTLLSF